MNSMADQLVKKCEAFIAEGDRDNALKCAAGISILTGQPAWEQSYRFLLNGYRCSDYVKSERVELPETLASELEMFHMEQGKEYPNQSVRGGTQVNLTHTSWRNWIEQLTGEEVIGLWTTRLPKGGFHIPHLHPRGENSHVLYVHVPESASGQLYFGVSRYLKQVPQLMIPAKAGMKIDFPCWLWHGVSTYYGNEPRIALAFDTKANG